MNGTGGRLGGGIVFDCDGVLANTTPCWEEAFTAAARDFGLPLGQAELAGLRGAALGTAARRIMRWSGGSAGLEEVLRVLRERLVSSIGAAELVPLDGVRDLLADLHGSAPVAVASNSPRAVLRRTLARLEITHHFAAAISAEDVARPKPAPDPYLAACAALGVGPRARGSAGRPGRQACRGRPAGRGRRHRAAGARRGQRRGRRR